MVVLFTGLYFYIGWQTELLVNRSLRLLQPGSEVSFDRAWPDFMGAVELDQLVIKAVKRGGREGDFSFEQASISLPLNDWISTLFTRRLNDVLEQDSASVV